MPELNWIAILAATVASFAVGALWYSPVLFAGAWQRAAGLTDEQLKGANMGLIFGLALLLNLVATIVFAMFLGPDATVTFGAGVGLATGLCWVTAYFGINYLFERRSLRLFFINGGYNTLAFVVMGAVLASLS